MHARTHASLRASITTAWLALVAAAGLVACGGNGPGFTASGTLTAAVYDPATPGEPTRFTFDLRGERVDPSATPGVAARVYGTCSVGPGGRTLRIAPAAAPAGQLSSLELELNDWSEDTCTSCLHGTARVTVGDRVFTAEDRRGGARSGCTLGATRSGSFGMRVTADCAGLRAEGDARTIDVTGTLALEGCDAPSTTGR